MMFMFWLQTLQSGQVTTNMGWSSDLRPSSGCYSKVVISGLRIMTPFYALSILQELGRAVFV